MKQVFGLIFILLVSTCIAFGQGNLRLKIVDAQTKVPIANAKITLNEKRLENVTDNLGTITISLLKGSSIIEISAFSYEAQTIAIDEADSAVHTIFMLPGDNDLDEVTLIASTRDNQAIENSPLKVEVLGKEEVNEEVGLKPGNIAGLLGDLSGVQIQQSSAISGNSNVRIQGLSGRYTQILRDGMPLYDGFSGGFGILTIPPLDLQQIELIKGSASTLYGGGAIAGLVNLISKRPTMNQEADVLVNYTSLNEFDANAYIAKRYKKVGYTLFTGYVQQDAKDVNNDGISDIAKSQSVIVHPKLFFYPSDKTIISIGYSGTFDQHKGGDMEVLKGITNSEHQFFEDNKSQRNTGEYSIEHFYDNNGRLTIKGLVSSFGKTTNTNTYGLDATQVSHYNEASFSKTWGKAHFVAGINEVGDDYKTNSPDTAMIKTISNLTVGAFSQLAWHFKENTILEGGIRADNHNKYGTFVLPRIAFFHRFNEEFATRVGFGMGYKTPNPYTPQDIEYAPLSIAPLSNSVISEKSYGFNAEGNYKKSWGKEKTLFINHAFFLTQVDNPILFNEDTHGLVQVNNASKSLLTMGFDTYLKFTIKKWELYGGYTYTDARRNYLNDNTFVPLTSRNRFAFVLVKEIEHKWRFGLEGSYFGTQYRYDGTKTPDYFFSALMVTRMIGKHFTIVANCENLFDYKMSNVESLYTGSILNPTFKPLWAPIDGRAVNLSLRWKL